jgi:hypothetical protein
VDPHPDSLIKGKDTKIRIRTKMSRIRNTAGDCSIFLHCHRTVHIGKKCSEPNFVAVLWNRNYFLRFRFRFRLMKSYGSGSDSAGQKVTVFTVPVPVPVPASYLDHRCIPLGQYL